MIVSPTAAIYGFQLLLVPLALQEPSATCSPGTREPVPVAAMASPGIPSGEDAVATRSPEPGQGLVEELLEGLSDDFDGVLADPEGHRLQLLYSEVIDGESGPELVRHGYRVDAEYFYPASTVKLAAAIASFGELRALKGRHGIDCGLDTPLRIHPLFEDDVLEEEDPSNLEDGQLTVGHAIRKLCLVSDNQAYNWLYELLGHEELNRVIDEAGLERTHLYHRLSEFRGVRDQRRTPRIELLDADRGVLLEIPARESELVEVNAGIPGLLVGKAHMSAGKRVEQPLDFSHKNYMPLRDLQDMLVMVCRPDIDLGLPGFDLQPEERAFLLEAMVQLPRESENPVYPLEKYSDDWVKFFLKGARRVAPEVRIYNKVGRAYGFSIENAYLVDEATGRAFFLAAVLYTNPNGVLNDGVYSYTPIADPFFIELGELFARHAFGG